MNIKTEPYNYQQTILPTSGKQIIGFTDQNSIVVYQAFNHVIADYAVINLKFGGEHYSFNRMSWIKPNFLWMMYRAGWAMKENQERILAIWLPLEKFQEILSHAVHSSFDPDIYREHVLWKEAVENSEVRLQWDPDHDPQGNKLVRKAIQIGMKGNVLEKFSNEWIAKIEDMTDFVIEQRENRFSEKQVDLEIPMERPVAIANEELRKKLGITN